MNKDFSITLIQCPCWSRETPPVALALLAGNLRSKGYKVHLFDLNNEFYQMVSERHKNLWQQEEELFWQSEKSVKELIKNYKIRIQKEVKKILDKGSQLVGFSINHCAPTFTQEIAKQIKNNSPNTLIVLGGPATAEYFNGLNLLNDPNIDAIVLREGDETLPRICADLKKRGHFIKTPGLVFKKNGEIINGGLREPIKSLDAIPFPDYSDFDLTKYANPKRLDFFATRSCINECYFCSERSYFQRFRFRSGENLFAEVKHQLSRFPEVLNFSFSDSALNGAPVAIRRFSELLLENNIRITWGGQAIISPAMTPELLKLMAKAGCTFLGYGVESGSNRVLKSMNKRITKELAAQVLRNTHEAGINAHANFMFGYPTETEEDFQMTLDFIRQNHKWLDTVYPSRILMGIAPASYLYEHPEEFGVEGSKEHSLFWTSQKGKNNYPIRLSRYERFCKLCRELGITRLSVDVEEERKDKWRLLGEYYQYKKDYGEAVNCYFKDFLRCGYSPESVKGFFDCYALSQDKEMISLLPYKGIKKLISLYNQKSYMSELQNRLREKESQTQEKESQIREKDSQISGLQNNLQEKESQVYNLEFQMQQIQQSILIQMASRYHRIMEKVLPSDTRRRHYYELCLTGIRAILNEGWRIFFKKLYYRSTYRPNVIKESDKGLSKFNNFISKKKVNKLAFPAPSEKPEVSIIIPAYNNWRYTFNCLKSICKNTAGDYEIIVVDDASTDETNKVLSRVRNLNLLRNQQNAGFVESCNRGAKTSRGEYILFLNNDTLVARGWLPPLLKLIKKRDVGAVGCKLVYPDGSLQEAGSIIWNDGSGCNYGRGDDPDKPEYNYIKEVDYCSGAALLVKKEMFEKIGGFDERFKPGYYEDTDLCFTIRKLGYKVMYQPMSTIVHFEGLTCGTDIHTETKNHQSKKYQEINKPKFAEKWQSILQNHHYSSGQDNVFLAREKCLAQRILVIDHFIPLYDKHSGSLRMFNMLQILRELGYKVTFIGYDSTMKLEPYTQELQQQGIETVYGPYVSSVEDYIEKFGKYFNVIILSRVHVPINIIDVVKKNCPAAKIIFDTVDLAFLRESRRAPIENNEQVAKQAEEFKKKELYLAQNSDITLVVSPTEKELLLKEDPSLTVEVVSNIHRITMPQKPFSERKDILFVGGFAHPPNVDAVIFFVKEIFPRVKQKVPNVRFYAVGGDPPKEILSLQNENVIVTGQIKSLLPYFENCKLSIAPLRYGAGVKGKINQSMSCGVPVVTTSIGAEGMGLIDKENSLIADDPDEFADKIVLLYNDGDLWSKLSRNSIKNVKNNFSPEVAKENLKNILDFLAKKPSTITHPPVKPHKRQTPSPLWE